MEDPQTRKMTLVLGYSAAAALISWTVVNVITAIITFTQ